LILCFAPQADFLGLDAFHVAAVDEPRLDIYLPLVLKNLSLRIR